MECGCGQRQPTLSSIEIQITFQTNPPAAAISSALAVTSSSLVWAGKTFPLNGRVAAGGMALELALSQSQVGATTWSMSEVVNALAPDLTGPIFPAGVSLFEMIRISDVRLTFGFDAAAPASLGVTANVDGDWAIIDSGLFILKNVGLSALALYRTTLVGDAPRPSLARNVHATTTLGSDEFDVVLNLAGPPWEIDLIPKNG